MDPQQTSPVLKKEESVSSDNDKTPGNFPNNQNEEDQHNSNEKSDNWAILDDIKST